MSKTNTKTSTAIIALLVFFVFIAGYTYLKNKPCLKPLTYRIGDVDERFGLNADEFATAVNIAAEIWNKALATQLFKEEINGAIVVNLVYDYRQEATDRLKNLNYKIDRTKDAYDELKHRLEYVKEEYDRKSAMLKDETDSYNRRVLVFNEENRFWQQRGGAPAGSYNKLMQEKEQLESINAELESRRQEIKQIAETLNSIVVVINEIAATYNLDLIEHKNTAENLGPEYGEGFYEKKAGKESITVYLYQSEERLIRVLAHELGHALGLPHSNDEKAIMYRLINSENPELSDSDIKALKKRCGINMVK
ncbi:MAG TPA: matrixin family metalloprotease [Smithellaceae bacterium]|nr:matrixin family metalloprotease [Smithellaceae bacterium]HRS90031.1 matrixin family metalloprotease [Smithellaceae bacterium]HRV26881.1 matrixin family metalloprotease [Smithellaceae bacterium]